MTIKEFLKSYNVKNGYGHSDGELIETMTEAGDIVWEGDREEHRWYITQTVVRNIDKTFIRYQDYIITGDNDMDFHGLEYDLDSAEIVYQKERTVQEFYYEREV